MKTSRKAAGSGHSPSAMRRVLLLLTACLLGVTAGVFIAGSASATTVATFRPVAGINDDSVEDLIGERRRTHPNQAGLRRTNQDELAAHRLFFGPIPIMTAD